METKVWFVTMETGEVGSTGHEIVVLPANYTDEQVQEVAWQMGLDHAEMYGIYPPSDGDSSWDDEEDEEGGDRTSENIEGFAEPYDPELHDGYSVGGDFSGEIEFQRSRM